MAAQKGRSFLLKIEDSASPASYTTVAGMTTTSMQLNNSPVDVTTKDSSGIQELLADAGVQSMSISADGRFTDGASEETLRAAAFSRTALNMQLAFPNGDTYEFEGVIESYSRAGPHDAEETFSVTISRSGAGSYTAA